MSLQIDEIAITYVMLNESILLENRIQYLKDNIGTIKTDHDPLARHKNVSDIIDHFAEHGDPTKNKVYTQYLVGLYKRGGIKQEDAYRAHEALSDFDKYKSKLSPEEKQINLKAYPDIMSIRNKVQPFIDAGVGATAGEQQVINRTKDWNIPGKHELTFEDNAIKLYKLSDKSTSQFLYGKKNDKNPGVFPTDWCTATQSEDHNMFDHYLKDSHPGSNLYVVHRKSDGAVFQYHTPTNQFMDSDDNEISKSDLDTVLPSLHKAWGNIKDGLKNVI